SASRTSIGCRSPRTSSGVGLGAEPMLRLMFIWGLENQLADAGETNTAESKSADRRTCRFIVHSIKWGRACGPPNTMQDTTIREQKRAHRSKGISGRNRPIGNKTASVHVLDIPAFRRLFDPRDCMTPRSALAHQVIYFLDRGAPMGRQIMRQ